MASISNDTWDLIFAGGGATACLVAGRLFELDPTLRILILEQGPPTFNNPAQITPGRWPENLAPGSRTSKHIVGRVSVALNGRQASSRTGCCVGGGSSINGLVYNRASASDYNDWETVYKNPGWGSEDLLPLLRKTETYQVKADEDSHGYSGPLGVSYGSTFTQAGQDFLQVAAAYDHDRPVVDDFNNLKESNGYARWPKWINARTGRRSDVPHSFVYPHPEIHVLPDCKVKRVLIEAGRAVGVEYISESSTVVARASRMIVLGAGAFGSPTILQRSGLGPKDVLAKNGVTQLVDLPGVGQNYRDHNALTPSYYSVQEPSTLGTSEEIEVQWNRDGSGPLGTTGLDAGCKLRPTPNDLAEIGPSFTQRWEEYFQGASDKPILTLCLLAASMPNHLNNTSKRTFMAGAFTSYPESQGFVNITSGDDINAEYDFYPGLLEHGGDLALLCWSYKKTRELARRMNVYRGENPAEHPKFPPGSEAICTDQEGPFSIDSPDLVYTEEDNRAIETFVRSTVFACWHSMGTCSMKPRKDGGVVDSRLNVYGVEGLKVADVSICPDNVCANTYSTALAIGEKAACIIAEDLRKGSL